MSDGFDADPDEIDAHAKKVATVQTTLSQALDAANLRMGTEAFGFMGSLFGLASLCNSTMQDLLNTLQSAVDTGERHVEAVHKWAEVKRVDEDSIQELLKRAEQ